jgi:hypothetical protein
LAYKLRQRFSTFRYPRAPKSKLNHFAYPQIKTGPLCVSPNKILRKKTDQTLLFLDYLTYYAYPLQPTHVPPGVRVRQVENLSYGIFNLSWLGKVKFIYTTYQLLLTYIKLLVLDALGSFTFAINFRFFSPENKTIEVFQKNVYFITKLAILLKPQSHLKIKVKSLKKCYFIWRRLL